MTYTQNHLKEALLNTDGDHLGEELLKKVPEALENPVAIIDSSSRPGRLVAIVEIPGESRNTIAAVEVHGTGKRFGKDIDSNAIVSIHQRDNAITKLLRDAIESENSGNGGIYYWQKNKAIEMVINSGVQFPGATTIPDGYVRSITDQLSKVNGGNKKIYETPQFENWFGNSVVKNADGTPMVVYHQTARDFWTFNTDNPVAGQNDSETPNGIFFKTNNHDIGLEGKKQMAVYLKIENLLHFGNREEANKWYCDNVAGYRELQDEMKTVLDPISENMDSLENDMFDDNISTEEYERLDAEWNDLLSEMKKAEDGYRGRLRNLLNNYFLNGKSKYDGIELDDDGHRYVDGKREDVHTYIVFKPSQVKSATHLQGDRDPDRHSEGEPGLCGHRLPPGEP